MDPRGHKIGAMLGAAQRSSKCMVSLTDFREHINALFWVKNTMTLVENDTSCFNEVSLLEF